MSGQIDIVKLVPWRSPTGLRKEIAEIKAQIAEEHALAYHMADRSAWLEFKDTRRRALVDDPENADVVGLLDLGQLEAEWSARTKAAWTKMCEAYCARCAPAVLALLRDLLEHLDERCAIAADEYRKYFEIFELPVIGESPIVASIELEASVVRNRIERFERGMAEPLESDRRVRFYEDINKSLSPWATAESADA